MDFIRLNAELDELVTENLQLDIVEMYDKSELLFLCKEAARCATAAHAVLEEIAKDYDVDLTKKDLLKVTHRLYMTDDTLENMRTTGLRTQLKELIGCVQKWIDPRKIKERWAQREQKKKKDEEIKSQKKTKEKPSEPVRLCPLREVQGGGMVHVP
mgnify:CR=1 FL=1